MQGTVLSSKVDEGVEGVVVVTMGIFSGCGHCGVLWKVIFAAVLV